MAVLLPPIGTIEPRDYIAVSRLPAQFQNDACGDKETHKGDREGDDSGRDFSDHECFILLVVAPVQDLKVAICCRFLGGETCSTRRIDHCGVGSNVRRRWGIDGGGHSECSAEVDLVDVDFSG